MNIPEGWKLVPVEPTEEMYAQFLGYDGTQYTNAFDKKHFIEDWERMLATAPTPPEQEQDDEPIYLVFSNDTYYDGSWEFVNKDEFDKADEDDRYKLYTRPDNSELRKAAEELINTFDRIKCLESRYGPCPVIENLRAALEAT